MFIWQTLPTWFKPSAVQLRMTAMSSTQVAISGYQSLTHVPDWPCWLNLRWRASSGVGRAAHRGHRPHEAVGQRLAGELVQLGLGSNRSMWLGPPSMKHQMTDLAFGSSGGSWRLRAGSRAAPAANPRARAATRARSIRNRRRPSRETRAESELPGNAGRSCSANPR